MENKVWAKKEKQYKEKIQGIQRFRRGQLGIPNKKKKKQNNVKNDRIGGNKVTKVGTVQYI